MRLITSFLIILAFPWVFRVGNTAPSSSEYCVAGMGYCLSYDKAIFMEPLREAEQYGGAIHSYDEKINGEFTAEIDAMKESFEQQYLAIMSDLEAVDPDLEQLNSMITDDFYYLSVQTSDQFKYYQAWRNYNRLVLLELSADAATTDRAMWEEAISGFSINWQ